MARLTRRGVLAATLPMLAAGTARASPAAMTERWGLHELTLEGPSGGNPFVDVTLFADFSHGTTQLRIPGFYDGNGLYRIRFSPPETGVWQWRTTSQVSALNGKTGTVEVGEPTAGNHGPVRVSPDGYHFVHADGTPYTQVGTTAYAWAQQTDALVAQTLATLAEAPFNKLRMCVFQNVAAAPLEPFVRTGPGDRDWDPARFNPLFFQRLEARIARLGDLGVEADIILFHPYDKAHGWCDMARADDEHYLAYVMARLSAYRHVWWSLANEYDLLTAKSEADWDHLGGFIQAGDPHDRLRSIHNGKALYDNRQAWVTHASVQNGMSVKDDTRAEIYRAVWRKPVIFDEVCYEGRIDLRWGNLSGEDMVSRFWHGLVGGTYVGHGETLTADNISADASWTGIGGTLRGDSAPRLAFLKTVMAAGPKPGFDAIDKWWDRHVGGQPGQYYLHYFGDDAPADWAFEVPAKGLGGGESFRLDVLDTWNMSVTPVDGAFTLVKKDAYTFHDPDRPVLSLGKPWLAVRAMRL